MEIRHADDGVVTRFVEIICNFLQRCLFWILSVGPVPTHIAFIMDGNRRYEKTHNLESGMGHRVGYISLMSLLKYCYQLGVRYVTVYAFSIDNFKRQPEEVQNLMELLKEKIESLLKAESIVHQYGIRVHFIGNLKLLDDSVRAAAEKAMMATAENSQAVLCICIAYTSTDEIAHASVEACRYFWTGLQSKISKAADKDDGIECDSQTQKLPNVIPVDANEDMSTEIQSTITDAEDNDDGIECDSQTEKLPIVNSADSDEDMDTDIQSTIRVTADKDDVTEFDSLTQEFPLLNAADINTNMYMSVAPDPDIVLRSSGETRLSNFLLWQTSSSLLYSPAALWPDIGLKHLAWAVLNFQRNYSYLQKLRKQA